ncbi:PREDICTED: uncharacterized protein LOC105567195 [Vollenhovia emeryi]|uniref:uncharacterized protein LOC105567195 n=1 Tax=Vollenhovia emeryi TaxID=411798 RepID=UPI0005F505CD|nr:PREDICTED: uncharacterized protein LOC105567195 [Vollenhovia emeryi]
MSYRAIIIGYKNVAFSYRRNLQRIDIIVHNIGIFPNNYLLYNLFVEKIPCNKSLFFIFIELIGAKDNLSEKNTVFLRAVMKEFLIVDRGQTCTILIEYSMNLPQYMDVVSAVKIIEPLITFVGLVATFLLIIVSCSHHELCSKRQEQKPSDSYAIIYTSLHNKKIHFG